MKNYGFSILTGVVGMGVFQKILANLGGGLLIGIALTIVFHLVFGGNEKKAGMLTIVSFVLGLVLTFILWGLAGVLVTAVVIGVTLFVVIKPTKEDLRKANLFVFARNLKESTDKK